LQIRVGRFDSGPRLQISLLKLTNQPRKGLFVVCLTRLFSIF
jgi:hypothetical protein